MGPMGPIRPFPLRRPRLPSGGLLLLGLRHEFVNRRVERLAARRAEPLVPDDPLVVDDVQGRPPAHVPCRRNRAARTLGAVPERAPGDFLLLVLLLAVLAVPVTVDADQGKGLAFEPFHERPLVWEHRHARPSPVPPEVE